MSVDHETQKAAPVAEEREEARPVLGRTDASSVPVEHGSEADAQEAPEPSFQEAPEGDL